jgi:hypothetical protein
MTNTKGYYDREFITTVKSFIAQTPGTRSWQEVLKGDVSLYH